MHILYLHGPQSSLRHPLSGGVLCIAATRTGHSGIGEQKFLAVGIERWCFFHLLRNNL